ncbi:hypothetical protein [Pedobacter sp. ok626]|uniref:hypothetical protein n=1 Tax=Pedobacter sp. ok626 TaxID=1761882 RepID=UPI0010457472|nr:hypothetical protein [Pedobacter sp. ok626]
MIGVLALIPLWYSARAQETTQVIFTISFADIAAKHFFEGNQDIDYLTFVYNNETLIGLNIYRLLPSKTKSIESYDLNFAGDRYILAKKYPTLVFPKNPKLQMDEITSMPSLKSKLGRYRVETSVKRDSIFNWFAYYTLDTNTTKRKVDRINRAAYKGDLKTVQEAVQSIYRNSRSKNASDSSLLITGFVDENGSLGNLKRVYGISTKLTLKTIEAIRQSAQSWRPAELNGKNVKYLVKFFIQLKDDGNVEISVQ